MSLYGDMNKRQEQNDLIWKALSDRSRREILDVLAERPQTTGELVSRFDHLCRTNVMKHVDVLVNAHLVIVRREGRQRFNYLNPAPIQSVCDRWVSRHVKHLASAMSRLKEHIEERERNGPKPTSRLVKKATKKTKG